MIAVRGGDDEIALTLSPNFVLHTDVLTTDRWGYLALIDADRCLSSPRLPPLDVIAGEASGDFVSVSLVPRCLAHFRVTDGTIAELWLTSDWHMWRDWLTGGDMT